MSKLGGMAETRSSLLTRSCKDCAWESEVKGLEVHVPYELSVNFPKTLLPEMK